MELDDILNMQENQRLQEIESQRLELQSKANDADLLPEVRGAYEIALASLIKSQQAIATETPLQNSYASYGLEGAKGLEQLQPLEGILADDQIAPLRESLSSRIETAKDFFEKYGAHSSQALEFVQFTGAQLAVSEAVLITPVVPGENPPDIEAEIPAGTAAEDSPERAEVLKTALAIKVRHGIVKIGKQGKSFKLSSTTASSYHDYSNERLAGLKALASGGDWTTRQLKEALGDAQMDGNHFSLVRNWLMSLTYGRECLVESPKRGTYRFSPKFEPEIIERTVQQKPEQQDFVINRGDMFIAARQLSKFNVFNRARFEFEISDELLEQLAEFAPDYSAIVGNEDAIWAAREEAFSRIDRVLNDDDAMYKFLSVISEDSPDFKFVDALINLDENQRHKLKRFMRSDLETETVDEKTLHAWAIERGTKDVVDHIQIDLRSNDEADYGGINGNGGSPEQQAEIVSEDVETPSREPKDIVADEVRVDTSVYYGEAEQPKRQRLSRSNRQRLDQIREAAEELALAFLERFSPDKAYSRPQIESAFSSFSTRTVANAIENNVGPSSGRGNVARAMGIHDVVNILIYSKPELQNIYSGKLKKQVQFVIKQTVEHAIETHQTSTSQS